MILRFGVCVAVRPFLGQGRVTSVKCQRPPPSKNGQILNIKKSIITKKIGHCFLPPYFAF